MSTLTILLPEEDLAFLDAYAKAHGTSAAVFLARQAHNLREHLQRPLRPEVIAASGIVVPGVGGETHRDHLEDKHS